MGLINSVVAQFQERGKGGKGGGGGGGGGGGKKREDELGIGSGLLWLLFESILFSFKIYQQLAYKPTLAFLLYARRNNNTNLRSMSSPFLGNCFKERERKKRSKWYYSNSIRWKHKNFWHNYTQIDLKFYHKSNFRILAKPSQALHTESPHK